MIRRHDGALQISRRVEVTDMARGRRVDGNFCGAMVVAVVEAAVPGDVELVAAHQAVKGVGVEMSVELLEIAGHLAVGLQILAVAADGHVDDGKKLRESDAEAGVEVVLVLQFEA